MILEAQDIRYAYPGGAQALDSASLAIRAGEKLAVLGHNGAGKSTLLLALNGTVRPHSGTILRHGQPVRYDRTALAAWRSEVGLVLQDPDDQLFAATVFEDVSFGPLNQDLSKDTARQRVEAALSAMGIAELAERPTHMLSFGQRKRVAIAGVLAMQPAVLLLDEPTAGLDPGGVDELMATLSQLAAAGTTVVIATHDMDVAYGWADRIALFADNRVLRLDTPEAAFADAGEINRIGLRLPLVYELGRVLADSGKIDAEAGLPRDRAGLIAAIAGLPVNSRP